MSENSEFKKSIKALLASFKAEAFRQLNDEFKNSKLNLQTKINELEKKIMKLKINHVPNEQESIQGQTLPKFNQLQFIIFMNLVIRLIIILSLVLVVMLIIML
jgi:hypothetical protein